MRKRDQGVATRMHLMAGRNDLLVAVWLGFIQDGGKFLLFLIETINYRIDSKNVGEDATRRWIYGFEKRWKKISLEY